MPANDSVAIEIDVGTSYGRIPMRKTAEIEVIPNEYGKKKTPNAVTFTETEKLIGPTAIDEVSKYLFQTNWTVRDYEMFSSLNIGRLFE